MELILFGAAKIDSFSMFYCLVYRHITWKLI
jgi:hypothetical protein